MYAQCLYATGPRSATLIKMPLMLPPLMDFPSFPFQSPEGNKNAINMQCAVLKRKIFPIAKEVGKK